jgi:hypothetical protein
MGCRSVETLLIVCIVATDVLTRRGRRMRDRWDHCDHWQCLRRRVVGRNRLRWSRRSSYQAGGNASEALGAE